MGKCPSQLSILSEKIARDPQHVAAELKSREIEGGEVVAGHDKEIDGQKRANQSHPDRPPGRLRLEFWPVKGAKRDRLKS